METSKNKAFARLFLVFACRWVFLKSRTLVSVEDEGEPDPDPTAAAPISVSITEDRRPQTTSINAGGGGDHRGDGATTPDSCAGGVI